MTLVRTKDTDSARGRSYLDCLWCEGCNVAASHVHFKSQFSANCRGNLGPESADQHFKFYSFADREYNPMQSAILYRFGYGRRIGSPLSSNSGNSSEILPFENGCDVFCKRDETRLSGLAYLRAHYGGVEAYLEENFILVLKTVTASRRTSGRGARDPSRAYLETRV